jgi:hypothetical protein
MAGQFLLALRAFAFDWKVMLHPVLLATVVMTHVGVAHGHQLTGGLLGLRSRRTRAVDNDLSLFVGDQLLRLVGLPRRQVDRARQVAPSIGLLWQRLQEHEVLSAIHLLFQFFPGDVFCHKVIRPLAATCRIATFFPQRYEPLFHLVSRLNNKELELRYTERAAGDKCVLVLPRSGAGHPSSTMRMAVAVRW